MSSFYNVKITFMSFTRIVSCEIEERMTNPRTNLFVLAAQIRRQETHSRVLAGLRRDSAILPTGLTRAFFLQGFAQLILTWVLSLCIICSASCVSIEYSYSRRPRDAIT